MADRKQWKVYDGSGMIACPTREHYWWRLGWLDAKDDGGQSGAHPTVPTRPLAAAAV